MAREDDVQRIAAVVRAMLAQQQSQPPVPPRHASNASSRWSVRPPSDVDKQWCKTWMSDSEDDGSCFALAYHHCVDGYKDQAGIPASVRAAKQGALQQVYDIQKSCTHEDAKRGLKKYACLDGPPQDWSSVCVARPDRAGKGKCKKVAPNEWRFWVHAKDPAIKSECEFPSLYLKSHVIGNKVQEQYTGKHGRG